MFSEILLDSTKQQSLLTHTCGQELLSIFLSENLNTHFQPIVDLKQRTVFAFEALTRGPENSKLYSPLNLFYSAEKNDCLLEMDLLARKTAIKNFANMASVHNYKAKLFINVSAQSMLSMHHKSGETLNQLSQNQMDLNQVVIEITELHPIDDIEPFLNAVNHYRSMGFEVALDDLGAGYNGLKLWSEVKPDYVKIDKHFICGIDVHADKYRFMETIHNLARASGAKIIAEGVETESELKVLEKIGIDYAQGFLLKHPSPLPSLKLEYEWQTKRAEKFSQKESIGCICTPHPSIASNSTVKEVSEFLLENPDIEFLPVLSNKQPAGIIWRNTLMNLLASPFGRDLHLKKPITHFIDDKALAYDASTALVTVSRDITSHGDFNRSALLITQNGKYLGIGTFMNLLEKITDLKVESAKYANPLSGLPGNVPIQTRLQDLIDQKISFNVIYVDVDNFKPYNDYYSFEQGDQVITTIASVLQSATIGKDCFIGHIGGDDFVILTEENYQPICERTLNEFSLVIDDFYHQEDQLRGGITAFDREGKKKVYPMMSLSLGVLKVAPGVFEHRQKLSSIATKAKKGAKAMGGNQFYVIDSADFKENQTF